MGGHSRRTCRVWESQGPRLHSAYGHEVPVGDAAVVEEDADDWQSWCSGASGSIAGSVAGSVAGSTGGGGSRLSTPSGSHIQRGHFSHGRDDWSSTSGSQSSFQRGNSKQPSCDSEWDWGVASNELCREQEWNDLDASNQGWPGGQTHRRAPKSRVALVRPAGNDRVQVMQNDVLCKCDAWDAMG